MRQLSQLGREACQFVYTKVREVSCDNSPSSGGRLVNSFPLRSRDVSCDNSPSSGGRLVNSFPKVQMRQLSQLGRKYLSIRSVKSGHSVRDVAATTLPPELGREACQFIQLRSRDVSCDNSPSSGGRLVNSLPPRSRDVSCDNSPSSGGRLVNLLRFH